MRQRQFGDLKQRLTLAFGGEALGEVFLVSRDGLVGQAESFEQVGLERGALGQQVGLAGIGCRCQQVRRALQCRIRPPVSDLDAAEKIRPLPGEPGAQKTLGQRLQRLFGGAIRFRLQLRFAQQQLALHHQLIAGVGARRALEDSVRLLQQLDHARPFGGLRSREARPRRRLAHRRIQQAG